MAIWRANDIRSATPEEIEEKLKELYKKKMKILGDIEAGISSESIGTLREIRRTIARILTIKKEKIKSKA
ncbi:MAG: 50S ribosomal protein L29 [Candidatus Altarchaeaceae archaeon]